MRCSRKTVVTALAGVCCVALAGFSCHADDMLTRASSLFRDRNYAESYTLAKGCPDSAQRTFLLGLSALRQGRAEEALPLLAEAERKTPLLADYAAMYQIEALMALKKYGDAATRAAGMPKTYPASLLLKKVEKLRIDSVFASGDFPETVRICQAFIERYPAGSDSVDALFLSGKSREASGDTIGAAQVYRSILLNNPRSNQAGKIRGRLADLKKKGVTLQPLSAEELLRNAATLYAQNEFSQALQALRSIPAEGQPPAILDRIALKAGMNYYRMRSWKSAEKSFARAAAGIDPAIRSEGRFWLGKSLERQEQNERAFALFLELAAEGRKQEFADDALLEAAGLRKGGGKYSEAARLYERVVAEFPQSRSVQRAVWEAGWSHYLAGEREQAVALFRQLLKDEVYREKALYWLGRALENGNPTEAASCFAALLEEYPAGFYATWRRDGKGLKDGREDAVRRPVKNDAAIPPGFEKPRLLASLGLVDEARSETAYRVKNGDRKGQISGLVRLYLEMGDYTSAMALAQQNKSLKWDQDNLPLWNAGYPLAYSEPVARHSATSNLPRALVFALMRAESAFSPAVKSPAGAVGLMQLMPATAKVTAREKNFNPARLTSPDYNIMLGTRHLHELLKGFGGDVVYAVAAYNAGTTAVERWKNRFKGFAKDEFIESIPYQETRDYVKKVYASTATYRLLYGLNP